jgi:hypothetical protein
MSVTGINNNLKNIDNIKGYLNSNDKKSNSTSYFSILTEGGKNKKDIYKMN